MVAGPNAEPAVRASADRAYEGWTVVEHDIAHDPDLEKRFVIAMDMRLRFEGPQLFGIGNQAGHGLDRGVSDAGNDDYMLAERAGQAGDVAVIDECSVLLAGIELCDKSFAGGLIDQFVIGIANPQMGGLEQRCRHAPEAGKTTD